MTTQPAGTPAVGHAHGAHFAFGPYKLGDTGVEHQLYAMGAMHLCGGLGDDGRDHSRHQPAQAFQHRDLQSGLARRGGHLQANKSTADDNERALARTAIERRRNVLGVIDGAQHMYAASPTPGTASVRSARPWPAPGRRRKFARRRNAQL
jgi:hypothetical protein